MRLFSNPASPLAMKIKVFIHEANMQDAVEIIDVTGHPTDPGYMPIEINPLGELPALDAGEGEYIFDSRVITRFLDASSLTGLYPYTGKVWRTLTIEAMADGIMDAAFSIVGKFQSRSAESSDLEWIEGQWTRIARALDAFDCDKHTFLQSKFDAAHIAVGCALGYLDLKHADVNWRASRPNLSGWFTELNYRPSFVATASVS